MRRLFQVSRRGPTVVGGDGAGGKKCWEAQRVLMVELTGLADGPDASCETEMRNQYDRQGFALRDSENG